MGALSVSIVLSIRAGTKLLNSLASVSDSAADSASCAMGFCGVSLFLRQSRRSGCGATLIMRVCARGDHD
jgi:hypothetical protein